MSKDINALMEEALDTAKELVTGYRQQDYGTPQESFSRIAALWTAFLGCEVTAEQVAMMMALLKIARSAGGKKTPDTYYDMLGYCAIAYALRPEPLEAAHNWPLHIILDPVSQKEVEFQHVPEPSLDSTYMSDAEAFDQYVSDFPDAGQLRGDKRFLSIWHAGIAYARGRPVLGWRMVPVKPTDGMRRTYENCQGKKSSFYDFYQSLLLAAPLYPYARILRGKEQGEKR